MVNGKTVTVEAIADHTYDGEAKAAGTQYEAEEAHVDFLTRAGYARVVEDEPVAKPAKRKAKAEE